MDENGSQESELDSLKPQKKKFLKLTWPAGICTAEEISKFSSSMVLGYQNEHENQDEILGHHFHLF